MTDILTMTAARLRALAVTDPARVAVVRAVVGDAGVRARLFLADQGVPWAIAMALPINSVDALASAARSEMATDEAGH